MLQVTYVAVLFLLTVNLVVLVHSSGHFIAARLLGIGVESVSVGLGPSIFSFSGHETTWRICWLPVGGYVRVHTNDKRGAVAKSIGVVLSGPLLSVVFALGVFLVLFTTKGAPAIQGGEAVVIRQSVLDGLIAAVRVLVSTWTIWRIDAFDAFASVYDTPIARFAALVAVWSSKFGIVNLLPLPKLDGSSILRLTLTAMASDHTDQVMKWVLRAIIILVALVMTAATINDLVRFNLF